MASSLTLGSFPSRIPITFPVVTCCRSTSVCIFTETSFNSNEAGLPELLISSCRAEIVFPEEANNLSKVLLVILITGIPASRNEFEKERARRPSSGSSTGPETKIIPTAPFSFALIVFTTTGDCSWNAALCGFGVYLSITAIFPETSISA